MQHMFAAHPGKDPEHMTLGFATSLSLHETRLLKPINHRLAVNFAGVRPPLDLYDARDVKYKKSDLEFVADIAGNPAAADANQPKWQLESCFPFLTFAVTDLRRAYVFLRMIAAHIENTMILSMPMAPYYGFTKTFDVRFDIPKEISNFEQFRRSILVRDR